MRSLLRGAAAAALVAAPCLAGDTDQPGQRGFTVEIGASDLTLREECSRRLSAWWDEMNADTAAPKGWDEEKLGPWALVVRSSGGGYVEERPGLVHVIVNVASEEIPSRADTADAYAKALLEGLKSRVEQRDRERAEPALARTRAEGVDAESEASALRVQMAALEDSVGGVPSALVTTLSDRRTELDRDAAQSRIDRAVTARKLEAARAAAERAAEVERLRREADDAERAAQAGPAEDRAALLEKVRELRRRVDELAKAAPSLAVAREEVFRLEVDLVGLEARSTVLAEEREKVVHDLAGARAAAPSYESLSRRLGLAVAQAASAQIRLRDLERERRAKGSVFQVIRAVGPWTGEEKKR